jgi:hypothetical protein
MFWLISIFTRPRLPTGRILTADQMLALIEASK